MGEDVETYRFTLGRQTITASGTWADQHHSNVLRLHIHRTQRDEHIHKLLLAYLPLFILRLIVPLFPLWTLPRTIILKRQKPKWDEEFDNEKLMYARLRPLQGSVIPILFGEASLDGVRALILSDVGRVTLCDPPALHHDDDDMGRMIDDALWALARFGVEYGDIKLDNFHLVNGRGGDRVVVVDLESVEEFEPGHHPERAMVYNADHLFRRWRQAVESDRREREEEDRREAARRAARLPTAEELKRATERARVGHAAKPAIFAGPPPPSWARMPLYPSGTGSIPLGGMPPGSVPPYPSTRPQAQGLPISTH